MNTLIQVKVKATNSVGTGAYSDVNTDTSGAKTKSTPGTMATPTKGSATSDSQIQVDWTALTLA